MAHEDALAIEDSNHGKPKTIKPRGENTMCNLPATVNPGEPQVKLDQFFQKILSVFTEIFKPSVPKFSGDPLEYSRFKTAFKVEDDKKEVYEPTEKRKSLLDAEESRVDTVVSAAKRRVDQFPIIVKEHS